MKQKYIDRLNYLKTQNLNTPKAKKLKEEFDKLNQMLSLDKAINKAIVDTTISLKNNNEFRNALYRGKQDNARKVIFKAIPDVITFSTGDKTISISKKEAFSKKVGKEIKKKFFDASNKINANVQLDIEAKEITKLKVDAYQEKIAEVYKKKDIEEIRKNPKKGTEEIRKQADLLFIPEITKQFPGLEKGQILKHFDTAVRGSYVWKKEFALQRKDQPKNDRQPVTGPKKIQPSTSTPTTTFSDLGKPTPPAVSPQFGNFINKTASQQGDKNVSQQNEKSENRDKKKLG